jgi:hypothetical protein
MIMETINNLQYKAQSSCSKIFFNKNKNKLKQLDKKVDNL